MNVERGTDRHAHRLLGDAVAGEDLGLTLGRRAAVAAHRWDDEGLCACGAELVEGQSGDVDGQCLVEPEIGRGDEAQDQSGTDGDGRSDRAERRRSIPCPGRPLTWMRLASGRRDIDSHAGR